MNNVKEFIKNNVLKNSTLVVACSGGPDSMCLLSLILKFRESLNLRIIIAHVNHQTRSECNSEEEFVRSYALKNNCIFKSIRLNEYQTKEFNEAEARRKRYNFFNEVIESSNANYLFTAHHGDDNMETILMRMTRGSNLNGYVGIKAVLRNDNYTILRPLLYVTKDDIINYNKDNKIDYVVDKTNDDEEHTRNRYRKRMLPFLKKENNKVHLKYLQFSEELNDYNTFVDNYIIKKGYIKNNIIYLDNIKNESTFIKRKCVEKIIKNIQENGYLDVNNKQIKDILDLMEKDNKQVDLSNGYICRKEYNLIKIVKLSNEKEEFFYKLDNDLDTDNFIIKYINNSDDDSNYTIRLLKEEINGPLYVRNRQDGDKIAIKNLKGRKKVKDIFIDEKIPKEERNKIPLVVNSQNEIIWLSGVKKSKFCKDKNEKCDIILKYEVKNEYENK